MQTSTIQIQANIQWRTIRTESGRFISVCDPLGLTTEADDYPELYSMIGETIHHLFLDLLHDNELDKFLKERGWSAHLPSNLNPNDNVHFDVPWEVIMPGPRDPSRAFN